MAYITFNNIKDYEAKIQKLAKSSKGMCKRVIYDGAGVMADAIKKALENLPIEEGKNGLPPYAPPGKKIDGVSGKQRKELVEGMGIAKMREERGYIYAKIGFDGYSGIKTKQWPNGIPILLLMRSIEAGTSFRKKNPVIRKTVNQNKEKTLDKMKTTTDKILEKEF